MEQVKNKDTEKKAKTWLKKEGFNEEGCTYVVKGETYSIKDQLKADGFRFNKVLMWHQGNPPASYIEEEKVEKIHWSAIIGFYAWGTGYYFPNAEEIVSARTTVEVEPPESYWYEEDILDEVPVYLQSKQSFVGKYGLTNIYTFISEQCNYFVWFTTKELDMELNANCLLSGKVKNKQTYKGVYQTVVTRCKVKEAD